MRRVSASLALIALFAAGAQAWWCTGHMTIAMIAKKNLDSGVGSAVDQQFQFLNQWFSKTTDLVSGACWADDLKSEKLEAMANWHFINQVYNPDNYPIPLGDWPIQKENVETQITGLSKTLESSEINAWEAAFATANLVHFYGDIHQPLHATDKFSAAYPTGDRGGNLIQVNLNGASMALHAVWDSVCGQYMTEPDRPLSQKSYDWISYLADSYAANFSVPDGDKKTYNSTVMALESYQAAVKYAYDNNKIKEGDTLSNDYVQTCMQVAGYRIAYAGYRLANELNYLFGSSSAVSGKKIAARVATLKKESEAFLAGKKH